MNKSASNMEFVTSYTTVLYNQYLLDNSSIITVVEPSPTKEFQRPPSWRILLLGIIMCIVVIATIIGNVVVLLAFFFEKKIRTTFSIYIINLAIVDLLVALTAILPFTIEMIAGNWIFGENMCNIWIFCDYGLTFTSVLTLVAISIDRFWSVVWGLKYRKYNTIKRALLMVSAVW